MHKKELLYNLVYQTFCRLKPSKVSGVGVFAIRAISKGVNPFQGCREAYLIPLRKEELEILPAGVKKIVKDFCILKNGQYWVPDFGLNSIDLSYYLNDSKDPNMQAEVESQTGDVEFITKRKIKNGEELTVDYKTYNER